MSGVAGVEDQPIGKVRFIHTPTKEIQTGVVTNQQANTTGTPSSHDFVTLINDPKLTVHDAVVKLSVDQPPMSVAFQNKLRGSAVYHPAPVERIGIPTGNAILDPNK